VTHIGSYAFDGCSGFSSLTIPNSVTDIGYRAFRNCSGFTGSLTIPNSVTSIGATAFANCSGFTGSLTIPNSVTSIGESAFANCSGFTGSLTIPNSVTSIGGFAFADCSGFTGSLTIPNSVTSIGYESFRSCSGFTGSLTIPNSVTSIGESAFRSCSGFTGSLTIPNSVTHIGSYAFQGCSGLTSVISSITTPFEISSTTFSNETYSSATLYVPAGTREAYASTDYWSSFSNIKEMEGDDCDLSDIDESSPYYDAASYLCSAGVISGSKVDGKISPETNLKRAHLAKIAFRGLYMATYGEIPVLVPSDFYPAIYSDLDELTEDNEYYYQAAKALMFLDYGDGITPFDRNRLNFDPDNTIKRMHVVKALLEAFDIKPNLSNKTNPYPNDSEVADLINNNPQKFGYIRKAYDLGIISSDNDTFRPNDDCLRGEAFVMLYRIMQKVVAGDIAAPTPDATAYYEPLNTTLITLALGTSSQQGNFNHYEKSSFGIMGKMPLGFSHQYSSYNTTLPEVIYALTATDGGNETYQPLTAGWTHTYHTYINKIGEGLNTRAVVHWGGGNMQVYKYDGSGYKAESAGVYDNLTVNGNEATIVSKMQVTYTFKSYKSNDEATLFYLTKVTDRNGNTLTLDYAEGQNGMKNISSVSDGSRSLTFAYKSGTNLLESVTDPIGRKISFGYTYNTKTAEYLLTSFTDAKGQTTNYTYGDASKLSTSRLLEKVQLPKGNYIENEYDANRRLKNTTSGVNGIPTSSTSLDVATSYKSNDRSTHSDIVTNNGTDNITVSYDYGSNNKISAVTSNIGAWSKATYGDSSNPHLPTNIETNTVTLSDIKYDDRGNATSVTVKSASGSDSYTQTMTYNSSNDMVSNTNPRGFTTKYTYDDNGNMTRVENPDGSTETYEYDSNGLMQSYTNPEGIVVNYSYNTYGNQTQCEIPSIDATQSFAYDDASRLLSYTNELGNSIQYQYDNNDNLILQIDPDGSYLRYSFDANDNMTQILNAAGGATVMNYDNATDLLLSIAFGSSTKSFEYNENGSVKAFVKADGTRLERTYNSDGSLASDGINTYTFDDKQRLSKLQDSNSSLTYEYDDFNRVASISYDGDTSNKISYSYDKNSNLTSITYHNGKSVAYEYDSMDRLISVTDWNNQTIKYTYYKDGRIKTIDYPNGMYVGYAYDAAGRLTKRNTSLLDGTVIASAEYTLDKKGNIISADLKAPYDDVVMQSDDVAYTYDDYNHILKAGDVSFSFDDNGNTMQRGDEFYKWDKSDRLIYADDVAYEYDPLGNIRAYGDTKYVVDVINSNVIADTKTSSYYIYGKGLLSRIQEDGTTCYYVTDLQGNVLAIVNEAGEITHKYQYDEFGNVLQSEETDFNPFRFAGKYGMMYNTDTHYYMRARHYDPTIGRFLSEDPVWSANLYPYVNNNPIMNVDVTGRSLEILPDVAEISKATVRGVKYIYNTVAPNLAELAKQDEMVRKSADKLLVKGLEKIENISNGTSQSAAQAITQTATSSRSTLWGGVKKVTGKVSNIMANLPIDTAIGLYQFGREFEDQPCVALGHVFEGLTADAAKMMVYKLTGGNPHLANLAATGVHVGVDLVGWASDASGFSDWLRDKAAKTCLFMGWY